MNNLLEPALSGQVPSFQSKNWIGNLLKMNYFEFSFRENEISAAKVCMATAGRASDDQEGPGAAGLSHFIELFKLNWNCSQGVGDRDITGHSRGKMGVDL